MYWSFFFHWIFFIPNLFFKRNPHFSKENLFSFPISSNGWVFFSVLCQWYRRRCLSVASWTRKQFHQTNYGMFLTLDICMHTCLIPVLPQIWYSYFKTIQSIKSLMYINIDVYQCFFPIRNNFEYGLPKHEMYFYWPVFDRVCDVTTRRPVTSASLDPPASSLQRDTPQRAEMSVCGTCCYPQGVPVCIVSTVNLTMTPTHTEALERFWRIIKILKNLLDYIFSKNIFLSSIF